MSWPYAFLTPEKQYHSDITTSVSAQRPLMTSKRHANNTGTAAYATKPVPTYFSITLPSKCNSSTQLPSTPLTRQEHRPVPPNANPAVWILILQK